jgi:two-component system, LytTR family, response regulator
MSPMHADAAPARLRTIVVDDEAPARTLLREYLEADTGIEIVAECANGFEAVKAITELRPDLVFLDVQMPKLDGFEVLDLVGEGPAVVFVTAYDEYALRAFDVHAVDYLLKPFGPERLATALEHVRGRLGGREPGPVRAVVAAARDRDVPAQRILVRDGPTVHVIPVDALDYVEAQDDYVCLHAGGRRHLKEQTMSEVEAVLDPARFVRIHRSVILNIERLARVEPYAKDSRVAILRDGTKLPVSRAGYARLNELL